MKIANLISLHSCTPFDYAALGDQEHEARLRKAAAEIRNMQRAAIVDIGLALIEVKERLPHGKFLKWIEGEFGWSRRTAVNMMQVAVEFGPKWETVAHIPVTLLYKLAAPSTPAVVRTALLDKLKPGQGITPRNVRSLISEARGAEHRKIVAARKKQERERIRTEANTQPDVSPGPFRYHNYLDEQRAAKSRSEEVARSIRLMLGPAFNDARVLIEAVDGTMFKQAFLDPKLLASAEDSDPGLFGDEGSAAK